jgi:hypothetical protein
MPLSNPYANPKIKAVNQEKRIKKEEKALTECKQSIKTCSKWRPNSQLNEFNWCISEMENVNM